MYYKYSEILGKGLVTIKLEVVIKSILFKILVRVESNNGEKKNRTPRNIKEEKEEEQEEQEGRRRRRRRR